MKPVRQHRIAEDDILELCLSRKVCFASYRLPGMATTTTIIQLTPEIPPLSEIKDTLPDKGFLIAPFSPEEHQTYLIQPDMLIRNKPEQAIIDTLLAISHRDSCFDTNSGPSDTRKADYLNLVHESVKRINNGEFDKVVLSRIKSVEGYYSDRLAGFFTLLCNSYPNAFVYLFHVNGQCWVGATPEPFVCAHQGNLTTVSLAGTKLYSEQHLSIENWKHKEIEEQEYVTQHIENILKNYGVHPVMRKGPYVQRAGNLLHLRTDFTFAARSVGDKLPSFIRTLHPTPAVCGMSTRKVMDFIRTTEKHSREYYSGFLGPVGIDDLMQLYVNLRCMRVYKNMLVLYTGGGITRDSVPEEEWEETEIKAETLLSVIDQMK